MCLGMQSYANQLAKLRGHVSHHHTGPADRRVGQDRSWKGHDPALPEQGPQAQDFSMSWWQSVVVLAGLGHECRCNCILLRSVDDADPLSLYRAAGFRRASPCALVRIST